MVLSVIIQKSGEVIDKKLKNMDKKYTMCNYKSDKDFLLLHVYENVKKYTHKQFEIYGKENGRANSENKYEFARPIDEKLFFGNLLVLMKCTKTDSYVDMDKNMWEEVNEILHGGFEDIGNSEDDERSVDSEVYEDHEYTAEGYVKDDFVVDDDELLEEEYNEEEDSDLNMSESEDEFETTESSDSSNE